MPTGPDEDTQPPWPWVWPDGAKGPTAPTEDADDIPTELASAWYDMEDAAEPDRPRFGERAELAALVLLALATIGVVGWLALW